MIISMTNTVEIIIHAVSPLSATGVADSVATATASTAASCAKAGKAAKIVAPAALKNFSIFDIIWFP